MEYARQTKRCRNWPCGNFTTLPVAEQVFPETGDDGSSRGVHKSSPEQQVRGRGTRGTAIGAQLVESNRREINKYEAPGAGDAAPWKLANRAGLSRISSTSCAGRLPPTAIVPSRKGNSPAISLPSRAPLRDSVFPDNRNLFRLSGKESRGEKVGNAEGNFGAFCWKYHGLV